MDERDSGQQQASSTDILKKNVIDYIFARATEATKKEDNINDLTHETGFVRGVRLAKSMLWKYTPEELRVQIRELYKAYDDKKTDIDAGTMTEQNKIAGKQMVADDISMQVLELLLVVLQYSPISTDFKSMDVIGDTEELIKAIRQEKPVKLFSGGIDL
jgi:FKBP-type peptidyl-prolyl cis-trans isomerase (trigger factor)